MSVRRHRLLALQPLRDRAHSGFRSAAQMALVALPATAPAGTTQCPSQTPERTKSKTTGSSAPWTCVLSRASLPLAVERANKIRTRTEVEEIRAPRRSDQRVFDASRVEVIGRGNKQQSGRLESYDLIGYERDHNDTVSTSKPSSALPRKLSTPGRSPRSNDIIDEEPANVAAAKRAESKKCVCVSQ